MAPIAPVAVFVPPKHPQVVDQEASSQTDEKFKQQFNHEETVQGTVRLYDGDGQVRNIPTPSDDPSDPLSWSTWRRCLIVITLCVFGITGFGVVQSTALFFGELVPYYERLTRGTFDASKISQLASYPSLCMGVGNFVFVPLSMMFGRRVIFVFNNALMFACIIWAAKSTDFTGHLAARCLQGLTCGISDCLLPLMILDITFLHQRGLWMSIYWASTAAGSTALLVAVPFVVHSAGDNWRYNYWFWSAFSGLSLVVGFFFLPETLFHRAPALINGKLAVVDAYGTVTYYDPPAGAVAHLTADEEVAQSTTPKKQQSYLSQLSLVHIQPHMLKTLTTSYWHMFLCLLTPSIFWTLLLNAVLFGGLVSQSITYAGILAAPPYNFAEYAIGTVQIGSTIGALIALGLTGLSSDYISGILTRKNGGVREAEHLLPNFLIPAALAFAGMITYGIVGGNPESHSWIGIHISFALYYCGFVALSAVTGVWIGEAVPLMAGPALVLVCGGRNALSFAISNNITAWIANKGIQDAYVTIGGVLFAVTLVGGVILFFTNKKLRLVLEPYLSGRTRDE